MNASIHPHGSVTSIALMYHAIGADATATADAHYTVATAAFHAQLDLLARKSGATCARSWLAHPTRATVLTFDDGHLSNYALAWPALAQRDMRADFFINPAQVGSDGFATWAHWREMAAHGMSIQSHGWNHRYFTELTPAQLRNDLRRSRHAIEDATGHPVTLLAPPGGRMPADLAAIAHDCGYRHVLGSQPGRINAQARGVLPRMAVTAALDLSTLSGWLGGHGMARAQLRYSMLGMAKRTLGDRGYERLRARLLGLHGVHA